LGSEGNLECISNRYGGKEIKIVNIWGNKISYVVV
jgi:hypothetical protein